MTMTNTDTRETLKSGFINNTRYMYTDKVNTDMVRLTIDDTVVYTSINYVVAPYVVLKQYPARLEFALADHPTLIESYMDKGIAKVLINLPIVDDVQQVIPSTDVWEVTLYNHREAERQSLSKALKPKADL